MIIKIGILKKELAFENLLNQIGVDWDYFSFDNPHDYSLLIINEILNDDELIKLNFYLKNCGAVFINSNQNIFNKTYTKSFVSSIYPAEINFNELIDINKNINLVNNKLFDLFDNVCIFPESISDLLNNINYKRLNFYSSKDRLPSENVNSVSKGSLSRLIESIFKNLHFNRRIVFASKSNTDLSKTFTFRIDTDKSNSSNLVNLYNLLDKCNISANWNIDVESQKENLNIYKYFKNQNFGFHSNSHKIFKDKNKFENDFSTAMEFYKNNNFDVKSGAGIYGIWNENLNFQYEKEKFDYSSEFSLSYDSLPFFPTIENKFSKTLQIPIHPICIGSLKIAGYKENEIINYFTDYINKSVYLNQPFHIYHHPNNENLNVLEYIFIYLKKLDIKNISYNDFFTKWIKRNNSKFEVKYFNEDESIEMFIDDNSKHEIDVFINENEYCSIDKSGKYKINELTKFTINKYIPPKDLNRIRNMDPRHFFQSFLFNLHSK